MRFLAGSVLLNGTAYAYNLLEKYMVCHLTEKIKEE